MLHKRHHLRSAANIAAKEARALSPVAEFIDGRGRPSRLALTLFLSLSFSNGCAGGPGSSKLANVQPPEVRRAKEVGKSFVDQRERSEYEAAKFAWRQNDVQGARELLEKLLKRNPGHREAGLLLAEILLVEQRPELARQQLQRTLSHHPADAETLHAMGLLLDAEDKPAEALPYFEQASQAAPDNPEYRLSRQATAERLKRGASNESVADGDSIQLATDLEPAQATADASPPSSSRRNAGPPEAEAQATSEPWLERVDAALVADQRESAHALVRKARRDAPHDESVPLSAAILALKRDELELAVEFAQDGITSFPESAGLHRTLGTAQYRLGDFKSAKQSLQQAVALDKSHPLSYFLLGSTLTKLGQSEAAEAYFRQAQRLDPRYAARR